MTTSQSEPLVFIVSGPSGSGKSTLVNKLIEVPGMLLSISCTTRPPYPSERPGEWYNFVSEKEFQRKIDADEFLEYARVFGKHFYGTPKSEIDRAQAQGKDLVLEIDVQGASQVKKRLSGAVGIFILPPSREELESRLRTRNRDAEEEIERRLDRAWQEMAAYKEYEYAVVNDNVETAGKRIQSIAIACRLETTRNRGQLDALLATFGGKS